MKLAELASCIQDFDLGTEMALPFQFKEFKEECTHPFHKANSCSKGN